MKCALAIHSCCAKLERDSGDPEQKNVWWHVQYKVSPHPGTPVMPSIAPSQASSLPARPPWLPTSIWQATTVFGRSERGVAFVTWSATLNKIGLWQKKTRMQGCMIGLPWYLPSPSPKQSRGGPSRTCRARYFEWKRGMITRISNKQSLWTEQRRWAAILATHRSADLWSGQVRIALIS